MTFRRLVLYGATAGAIGYIAVTAPILWGAYLLDIIRRRRT